MYRHRTHDLVVLLCTACLPLLLVVATEVLKSAGKTSTASARKFLHIATGLIYLCTWPLYSPDPSARYFAAALPGLMAVRFVLAGLGITHEPKLVAGTSRTGNKKELLGGPALYGLSHVILTVVAWRSNPAGAAGIAALCAGDGMADVVGRRWGAHGPLAGSLPHNKEKSWIGSVACFLAACAAMAAYTAWFSSLGFFNRPFSFWEIMKASAWSSLVATVVETLQGPDNVTMPAAAALAAWCWTQ